MISAVATIVLTLLLIASPSARAFQINQESIHRHHGAVSTQAAALVSSSSALFSSRPSDAETVSDSKFCSDHENEMHSPSTSMKLMGITTSVALAMSVLPTIAMAADDIEYADLPPPYVPVAFGFALLLGVGLLTGSLGDVMEQEASLGLQSGARAKKEIERSRSSYFKKK